MADAETVKQLTDFIDRVLMNNFIIDFLVDDQEISSGIFDNTAPFDWP